MKIVLFDIDGTLLTMGGATKAAFLRGLSDVVGKPADSNGYSFVGKTDPQIARDLLAAHGYTGHLESGIAETLRRYLAYAPEERGRHPAGKTCPGVRELLAELRARSDCRVALLTGNVEPGARFKLSCFDLESGFDYSVSAFGSDDPDRYRLPALALSRARASISPSIEGSDLVVVGDSEHDVLCGRSIGVRAVAVATGWKTEAELASHGPDALLRDFSDTSESVRAILG